MCVLCARASLKLMDDGYSQDAAMSLLWNATAYPMGDGEQILAQVRTLLRVKRRNRRRWLIKQDNRMMRTMDLIERTGITGP